MNRNGKIIPLIAIFSSILTIIGLIVFYSQYTLPMWGWTGEINSFILLLPILILIISLLNIIPFQESRFFRKISGSFFTSLEKNASILLLLFLSIIEILLFLTFFTRYIPKGLVQKSILDFLLIFIILCITLLSQSSAGDRLFEALKNIKLKPTLLLGGLFLLLIINFKITGIDSAIFAKKYFGAGAPVTFSQAIFAFNSGLLCYFLFKIYKPKQSFFVLFDISIALLLFIAAYFFWNSPDIPLNHFLRLIDSNSFAPYSDSRAYDLNGLGFAFGQGIGFGYPTQKPLYSFFLGLLHLIFGHNYTNIISAQVLVLSLMPLFYYFISRQLFSSGISLSGSIFIIFKEYNLVILSSEFTQSSVKMIMTDCFFTLFVLVLCFVTLRWINTPSSKKFSLLTGACLSITILIRIQMAAFVILYIISYLISQKPHKLNLKGPLVIFLVGIALILLPWMSRNLIRSGQFSIEQPEYISYAFIPQSTFSTAQKDSIDPASESLLKLIFSNSGIYLKKVSSYLNNSFMSSLYQLPTNIDLFKGLQETINSGKYSYPFPYQELSIKQGLIWGINLLIVFGGIVFGIYRYKWKGVFPLIFYLFFAFIVSFAGYSGWRFIQPVDWIIFLYWNAGLLGIVEFVVGNDSIQKSEYRNLQTIESNQTRGTLLNFMLVCIIGLLLPLSELLVPSAVNPQNKNGVFNQVVSKTSSNGEIDQNFIKDPLSIVESGISLYPIYIYPNDNLFGKIHLGFDPFPVYYSKHVDFLYPTTDARFLDGETILYLTLANSVVQDVYLFKPQEIILSQSGENATVLGCNRGDFIQAYWIEIGDSIIVSSEGIPKNCSSD